MTLFARAGAVVSVVLYMKSPGSADAQQTLVLALTIYWTAVAVTLTWVVDGFVRAVRGRFTRRS